MKFTRFIASVCIGLACVSAATADDTEVFFGQASENQNKNPNILFILDTSGSMSWDGASGESRMTELKAAMTELLEESSDFNVGMMAFQGGQNIQDGGAVVRYPVGYLEDESDGLCGGRPCGDEVVVSRPASGADDGFQNDDTNAVTLATTTLTMADIEGSNAEDDEPSGPRITGTVIASSEVAEARNSEDKERYNEINQSETRWFFWDKDNFNKVPVLYGYRFEGLDIPKNAQVINARITFTRTERKKQSGDVAGYLTAEATGEPEPYPDGGDNGYDWLADRNSSANRVSSVVAWDDIPKDNKDADADKITSPDIGEVLTELVGLVSWQRGQSASILISPADTYNPSTKDDRIFFGTGHSNTDNHPVLEYTYVETVDPNEKTQIAYADAHVDEIEETATGEIRRNTGNLVSNLFHVPGDFAARKLGLRFDNIEVPVGATLKSAELILHSANDSQKDDTADDWSVVDGSAIVSTDDKDTDTPAEEQPSDTAEVDDTEEQVIPIAFNLNVELDNTPDNFNGTPLRDRTYSSAFVAWEDIDNSEASELYSPNIAEIVSELTEADDWVSGRSIALLISATEGYQNNETNTRRILSSIASGDLRPRLRLVYAIEDDEETKLNTRTTALRFPSITVPPGTVIDSAEIVFHSAANNEDEARLVISAELTGDSEALTSEMNNIGNRSRTQAREVWEAEPWANAGVQYSTPDISRVIQEVTDQSSWCSGNTLTLFVDGVGLREAIAYEQNASQAPALKITYALDTVPSDGYCVNGAAEPVTATLVRDSLLEEINSLNPTGGTPIVSALYEGAQYFSGGEVNYGKHRGNPVATQPDYRVSHPKSYINGRSVLPGGCTYANLDAPECAGEFIEAAGGTPTYVSPIQNECQANIVVLLSDGEPTQNTAIPKVESLIGSSCALDSEAAQCGPELASWLNNTDLNASLPGIQNLVLHTVGFNVDAAAGQYLESLAINGGGEAFVADNTEDLLNVFRSIFETTETNATTFVAPALTLDKNNRTKHREDIYFGLFYPNIKARWPGNLKRYSLAGDDNSTAITGVNGEIALDETTGQFKTTARSYWSSGVDGGDVSSGGAAEMLSQNNQSYGTRSVYTYNGSDRSIVSSANRIYVGNASLDKAWFDLPGNRVNDSAYFSSLIEWTAGRDVFDADKDGNTDEGRPSMGDPLHSQPVLINYPGDQSVVFMATNQGYLHAIDSATGRELWSFIPQELLKNLRYYYDNVDSSRRPYGLDGDLTLWIDDVNNNGQADNNEQAILYIGMRRGGNRYYAIDVSNRLRPEYLWNIEGGKNVVDTDPTTADGDYVELGQTWSRIHKTKVMNGERAVDAIIFAGGYDTNQDAPQYESHTADSVLRRVDGVGRSLFIADARTGKLLWKPEESTSSNYSSLQYSIPSDPRVIDINHDGYADMVYVGDMGGQLWRFDIQNDSADDSSLSERTTGGVIAELADDTIAGSRRFFSAPDVALISEEGKQKLAISIGSGWRAHPLNEHVDDRFFTIKSTHVYGPPVDSFGKIVYPTIRYGISNFNNVTNDVNPDPESVSKGWYLDLPDAGEKVLAGAITANNRVVFTSYRPNSTAEPCDAVLGASRLYSVSVFDGRPMRNEGGGSQASSDPGDRQSELDFKGIPPSPTILFNDSGAATVMMGTEELEQVDIGELRRKTFWQEHADASSD